MQSNDLLYYFTDTGATLALGAVIMTGLAISHASDVTRPFCISLKEVLISVLCVCSFSYVPEQLGGDGKELIVSAESEAEYASWMEHLVHAAVSLQADDV